MPNEENPPPKDPPDAEKGTPAKAEAKKLPPLPNAVDRKLKTLPPIPKAPVQQPAPELPDEAVETHEVEVELLDPVTAQILELGDGLAAELATDPEPHRAARIHYELARISETVLGDVKQAAKHYLNAQTLSPDHLPSIRGAKRTHIALKDYRKALPLFDAEVRVTADSDHKAAVLLAKGRLIEDGIGGRRDARAAYCAALELEGSDQSILRAIEQTDVLDRRWNKLANTYEHLANAVSADLNHRATLVSARAHLVETRLDNLDLATELYEAALRLDPYAPGALAGLKRLYAGHERWQELIRVLELEAELSKNANVQALALFRVGMLHCDKLHNRLEAITALQKALGHTPRDVQILGELICMLEMDERFDELFEALVRMLELSRDTWEQLDLTHRLGRIALDRLGDEAKAVHWYRAALEIDPLYLPALQALGKLYEKNGAWIDLITMYEAEAVAHDMDPQRQATAHHRIAHLYEEKLADVERAIEHNARAVGLFPEYEAPFKTLTRLYAQLGRYRELIDTYQKAVEHSGELELTIAFLLKIGSIYEDNLSEPIQAAQTYRNILERDENHLGAVQALQRALERAGRYRELVDAIELEAEKVTNQDRLVSLHHRAGIALLDHLSDYWEKALAQFCRVLELQNDHLPTLRALGRVYYYLGRWEDLLDTYERELKLLPDPTRRVNLLVKMGELCEHRLGSAAQAVELYRRAVEADPGHRPAHNALVRLYQTKERWEDLLELLETELAALKSPKDKCATLFRMGSIAEDRLEDPIRALKLFRRALSLQPKHRPAVDAAARLYSEAGNWTGLVELLSVDVAQAEEHLIVISALMIQGQIYQHRLGDPQRATECFEAILERDPNHLGALLALENLYREAGQTESLAQIYTVQSSVFKDAGARVAALRELARIQASADPPVTELLNRTYASILKLEPQDLSALDSLANWAVTQSDRELLAGIDARLVAATTEPNLRAMYLTRLAESQEVLGNTQALQTYREAIQADPDNLAAARGFSRIAEANQEYGALVEAAEYEAQINLDKQSAARLLTLAAGVAVNQLRDGAKAVDNLQRALEILPGHGEAASQLIVLLVESGQLPRLVALLTQAAGSAAFPTRRAELWMEVATIQDERLNDLAGAIGSLRRLLDDDPKQLAALSRLSGLLCRNAQWQEAVEALDRILAVGAGGSLKLDVHLLLAQILDERLEDPKRAMDHARAVLKKNPTNTFALERMLGLYTRKGQIGKAATTARKLLKSKREPKEQAELYTLLGGFEAQLDKTRGAAAAFEKAVALEGPSGEAAHEYKQLVETVGSWEKYANALQSYTQRCEASQTLDPSGYLELARTQAQKLGDVDSAVATLQTGLTRIDGALALRAELAELLAQSGKLDEALAEYNELVRVEPTQPESWRGLAKTLGMLGRGVEATMAMEPVRVLGVAEADDRDELPERARRTGQANPGSFSSTLLRKLGSDEHETSAAAVLVKAMLPGLSKLYPVDKRSYGVTDQDRIVPQSGHPIGELVTQTAAVFGLEGLEIFQHRNREKGLGLEMGSTATLMVPDTITSLSHARQIFMLAQPMAYIARGLHPLWTLPTSELELLLAAATQSAGFRSPSDRVSERELDDRAKRLVKSLPRRARPKLEEAARGYANGPRIDCRKWQEQVGRSSARAALLLADDLAETIQHIKESDSQLAHLTGAELARRSNLVADLMGFWVSEQAHAIRTRVGLWVV